MHCLVCKKPIPDNNSRRLCPEHSNANALFKSVDLLQSKDFYGKAPNVFIGSYGYPNVNIGILSPPERKEDTWLYDAPNFWAEQQFDKQSIIGLRSSLINSRFKASVKDNNSKFLEAAQEISMASKPVDVDIILQKKPYFKLNINDITMPHGPKADLTSFKLAENPSIPTKVDKIVSDTDLKSVEGLNILYNKGINENDLIKLLSVGNLGIKLQRRLVPTRWSITAVHDQLGKSIINGLKDNNHSDHTLFFGGYMHNYFLVMFFPDVWAFELFETYVPEVQSLRKLSFTTDFEFYGGRKSYAKNCVGGYYAARLAVLEKMKEMKKQGTVLVLRFTTFEYDVSLGVWVVLEATRKALESHPLKFDSREEMLKYAKEMIQAKFEVSINQFLFKSQVLKQIKTQKKLFNYF
jgi:hypothetical protein